MKIVEKAAKPKSVEKKRYSFTKFRMGGDAVPAVDGDTLVASCGWNCEAGNGLNANNVVTEFANKGVVAGKGDQSFTVGKVGAEKICYINTSGDCFLVVNDTFTKKGTGYVRSKIVECVGKDGTKRVVLCGWHGVSIFDGETFSKISETPTFYAAYAGERLFLVGEDNVVRYSAPLDENDFSLSADDGGFFAVDFRFGKIIDMEEYDGSLYLFSALGISRLEVRGAARDFSLKSVHYDGKSISTNTAARCDKGVCFLAEDGVYLCSGLTTKKLLDVRNFNVSKDYAWSKAICSNGQYFVRVSVDGLDCTLAVHLNNGQASLLNVWEAIGKGFGYPLFANGEKFGGLFNDRLLAANSLESFLMGYTFTVDKFEICTAGEQATFERMDFCGRGALTVVVSNGKEEKSFRVALEDGEPIFVRLKGNRFSLTFTLDAGAELERVDIATEKLKR
ncbi:MAG: hypothetical protein IJV80_00050 [Clostridia bacterium]|nr:hypothetical protein [Clostridia bacterium]